MLKFPGDSYDVIERLYGDQVTRSFPNYGKFWELFIGHDSSSAHPGWKQVTYPKLMTPRQKRRFETWREEVHMAHYSLFCNIAGCLYQISRTDEIIKSPITEETYFQYWEHFDCFYMRLGNCFFQIFHLWNLLARFDGLKKYEYMRRHGIERQWRLFEDSREKASVLRNNLVHHSRVASVQRESAFYIPMIIKSGGGESGEELWSRQHKRLRWVRTDTKIKEDFIKSQRLINRIHKLFIKQYRVMLRDNNIAIRRSK